MRLTYEISPNKNNIINNVTANFKSEVLNENQGEKKANGESSSVYCICQYEVFQNLAFKNGFRPQSNHQISLTNQYFVF